MRTQHDKNGTDSVDHALKEFCERDLEACRRQLQVFEAGHRVGILIDGSWKDATDQEKAHLQVRIEDLTELLIKMA
jgi:ribosomal protein L21E